MWFGFGFSIIEEATIEQPPQIASTTCSDHEITPVLVRGPTRPGSLLNGLTAILRLVLHEWTIRVRMTRWCKPLNVGTAPAGQAQDVQSLVIGWTAVHHLTGESSVPRRCHGAP